MEFKNFTKELHKPIFRKFEKLKVQSSFIGNNWGGGLGNMELISKFNKGVCFLLCVIDIFSKYAWIVTLKGKIILQLLTQWTQTSLRRLQDV